MEDLTESQGRPGYTGKGADETDRYWPDVQYSTVKYSTVQFSTQFAYIWVMGF